MALSIAVGTKQLLQLGISLADVALIVDQGRKFGNWLRVAANDQELFSSIGEDPEALLKRHGLLDITEMDRKWSTLHFVYQGKHHRRGADGQSRGPPADLNTFSWVMVAVVSALDLCMSSTALKTLLINVYARGLDANDDTRDSLRVLLSTNIESWRSSGCIRGVAIEVAAAMRKYRIKILNQNALPQLNLAETKEMENFLVWLLVGTTNDFNALSVTVYTVAIAMKKVGIRVRTEGVRNYESEPYIHYVENTVVSDTLVSLPFSSPTGPFNYQRGIETHAQLIAYPRNQPSAMIQAMPLKRQTLNRMEYFWELGSMAAQKIHIREERSALLPYEPGEADIFYEIENGDPHRSRFTPKLLRLEQKAFGTTSEGILTALEELTKGLDEQTVEWLDTCAQLQFLQSKPSILFQNPTETEIAIFSQYQALVFGFYYSLLERLVCFDMLSKECFFRGLWGLGSCTFLAMCSDFGRALSHMGSRLSRTHILHMLSTMYNGRPKVYTKAASKSGLLAVLGSVSVLSTPLLRVTDSPTELASFVVLDAPILDLMAEPSGELYSGDSGGFFFASPPEKSTEILPREPGSTWSLHPKMGSLFSEERPGSVVIAARCDGRLVGWFSPLAADVVFLSGAYCPPGRTNFKVDKDKYKCTGFEMTDRDWQDGRLLRPFSTNTDNSIGVIHSKNCPALRYAAAGFYAGDREEVCIATDDIEVAYDRIAEQGVLIA